MYKSSFLWDPNAVLRFQNFCGLSKSNDQLTSRTDENDPINGNPLLNNNEARVRACSKVKDKYENKIKAENVQYNPYLHRLYAFGSGLGSEAFYITFIPLLMWIVDEYVSRRLILLWVVSMYSGQLMKEKLRWPRPPSPPVIIVQHDYDNEFGMPSTHAVAGTIFPFTLVYFAYDRYGIPLNAGVLFFVFWCTLVCLSRIYMGVHSFQDLLGGVGLAAVVIVLCLPILDQHLEQIYQNQFTGLFLIVVLFLMVYFYPVLDIKTSSRRETVRIVASGGGAQIGFWINFCFFKQSLRSPYEEIIFSFHDPGTTAFIILAKFVLGVTLLLAVRFCVKSVLLHTLPGLSVEVYNDLQKENTSVILCIFITYASIGTFGSCFVPQIFQLLGFANVT